MYDLKIVKDAASGDWPAIINRVGGIADDFLTTKHGPCPRCGGKDRWRTFNDFNETGGANCNQCGKFADGVELIRWACNCKFQEALQKIGDFLGIQPNRKAAKADPAKDLAWMPWNEGLVRYWCLKKPPITPDAIQSIGGRLARYRDRYTVIAIPAYGQNPTSIVAWSLYDVGGGMLPVFHKGDKKPEMRKVKSTYGSEPGLMGIRSGGSVVWKTEGPSDLLALISLGLPEGHSACCNVFGAGENPLGDFGGKAWMIERFRDTQAFVIHDCDKPGQDGATYSSQGTRRRPGWAPCIAQAAKECRNVVLPFAIEENHGKDLRDWISDQLSGGASRNEVYQKLLEMAEWSPQVANEGGIGPQVNAESEVGIETAEVTENEDDPHRLARINLKNYEVNFGGRLVYWRDEWWRWKAGKYVRMANSELEAKLNAAIKVEFDRSYKEAIERGKEVSAVNRVTQSLVKNVLGASKSYCVIPSSIEMPCWLEDRSKPHWVAMRNGILDLTAVFDRKPLEECLKTHNSDWFSSFCLDYDFDLDANCERWLKYLDVVMEGDEERIALLQEWVGYLLTPTNDLQRFMCFEGEGGNGKTVFFAAIEAMLGHDNIAHVPLENFGGRFDLGTTLGKAVNIAGDVGELDQVSEGQLKQFTGGDVMHFDRKMLPPISARPTAKLMCAWNNRPKIKDRSSGLWRRMILVPFNRQILAAERIRGMDRPGWWTASGEAAGILNWALAGLWRLQQQGDFTGSRLVSETMLEYRRESNPAAEYLEDYFESCDFNRTYEPVDSSRIYDLYRSWCGRMGFHPLGNRTFFKELVRMYPSAKRVQIRNGVTRSWAYVGIKFAVEEIAGEKTSELLF